MTKPHKKRLISGVILLVFCSILLIIIDKNFTKPTTTTAVISPYPLPKQTSLTLIPKNYSDNYVSFNYPSIMLSKQAQQPSSPIVDNITFSYPDIESWLLAIEIYNIPGGNFYNNEAYQARLIDPSVYKLTQTTVNGTTVPIFTDTTAVGYKRVAFLISGNYQATVSLTGNDASGITPLVNTMAMILNSWQWQGSY